jgi:hypothetical protein
MDTSAYGSDPPIPNSHVTKCEKQREVKARADADKAKKKQREEHCHAHHLEWVQWKKECMSLPPTPNNTSSHSNGGMG